MRVIYSKYDKKIALYIMTTSVSSSLVTGAATVGHLVSTATTSNQTDCLSKHIIGAAYQDMSSVLCSVGSVELVVY